MSDRFEMNKQKKAFKKRDHRPWQSSLLEDVSKDTQNVLDVSSKLSHKQSELLQKQMETALQIKAKEKEELSALFNALTEDRITVGGFLRPKHILQNNENETLQKTASLVNELKEKEFEIQHITQNLKITQAEEFAERAEKARLNEEKARHAAEEKAIFALRQANLAAEQIKQAEEKIIKLENNKARLDYAVLELEDKLKIATHELQILGQKTQQTLEQKQKMAYELKVSTSQSHQEKQHRKELEAKLKKISLENEEIRQIQIQFEMQRLLSSERIHQLEHEIYQERQQLNHLNSAIIILKEEIEILLQQPLQGSHHEILESLHAANFRLTIMEQVLIAERNLRKFYEKKLETAADHDF